MTDVLDRPVAAENEDPDGVDAFGVLGLPYSPDLTDADVRRAYLLRLRAAHPDNGGDTRAAAGGHRRLRHAAVGGAARGTFSRRRPWTGAAAAGGGPVTSGRGTGCGAAGAVAGTGRGVPGSAGPAPVRDRRSHPGQDRGPARGDARPPGHAGQAHAPVGRVGVAGVGLAMVGRDRRQAPGGEGAVVMAAGTRAAASRGTGPGASGHGCDGRAVAAPGVGADPAWTDRVAGGPGLGSSHGAIDRAVHRAG